MFSICDVIIFLIILVSGLFGFGRGFIRELSTILNWGIASYLSVSYHHLIKIFFQGYLPNELLVPLSVILMFFVSFFVISMVTHFLRPGLLGIGFGVVDKPMGFAFGLIRGVILGGGMIIVLKLSPYGNEVWLSESMSHQLIKPYVENILKSVNREQRNVQKKESLLSKFYR